MVNRVILVGRLGRDPEMRQTGSGTPVTNFSVATNETWNAQNGERQERTEWHNIVTWNKLAEICNEYLSKGQLVYIEGRLQTREWDDRDGNKRRTTEVVASGMRMLSPRSQEDRPGQPVGVAEGGQPVGVAEEEKMDSGLTDDDIPF